MKSDRVLSSSSAAWSINSFCRRLARRLMISFRVCVSAMKVTSALKLAPFVYSEYSKYVYTTSIQSARAFGMFLETHPSTSDEMFTPPLSGCDLLSQPCIDELRRCDSLRFCDLVDSRNDLFVDRDKVFSGLCNFSFRQSTP